MSDPTMPAREVIARGAYQVRPRRTQPFGGGDPVPWEQLGGKAKEWGGYVHADTIITALSEAGWEIVRTAPEPDAPEITDAMIEAAARVFFTWNGLIREIPEPNLKTQPVWKIAHAALDAALKARG